MMFIYFIGDDDNTNYRSPERQLNYGEEWAYSLELSDEYAFDDEVGKRLNQMASVPVSNDLVCFKFFFFYVLYHDR